MKWSLKCGDTSRIRTAPIGACCFDAKIRASPRSGRLSLMDRNRRPHLSEFEQEALFQEWVRTFLGTNPTKMDDDVYSSSFEVFKSHMFVRPESAPSRSDPRPAGVRRSAVGEESVGATEPVTIDLRVKEIYRRLVRRLHPDLRADGDASVSSL